MQPNTFLLWLSIGFRTLSTVRTWFGGGRRDLPQPSLQRLNSASNIIGTESAALWRQLCKVVEDLSYYCCHRDGAGAPLGGACVNLLGLNGEARHLP